MTHNAEPVGAGLSSLRPLARGTAVMVAGMIGFVAVVAWGLFVKHSDAITTWDQGLLGRINAASSAGMDAAARLTSVVFSPAGALVWIVGVVVVLWLVRRRLGDALFVGFTIGVVYAATYVVKEIVGRPRPAALPHVVAGLSVDTSPGYPSGHVAMSAALAVVLFLVVARRGRWLVALIGVVLVAWTAYARLYAGAHYLDDVVASAVFAVTMGPLIYQVLHRIDATLGLVRAVNGLGRQPAADPPSPARRPAVGE